MTIKDIIHEVFVLKDADRPDTTVIMDMPEWDSMTHMTFILRLESEFNVMFTGDEIAQMRTIADVREALAAHKVTA